MGHPGSNRWSVRKRFVDRLQQLRATQHGFTLLELLIGIVIVSILAAVATQYFLHQRRKGWVAQVRASTRHMAGAQNYFIFGEGASGFTNDLDDLYMVGYRWDDFSVRPYVALATNQTYCVQVHSAHDPSIVWHFSSNTGYPQEGPATPSGCGDPEVLGTYIAGLPPASAGRDGVPGGTVASTDGPGCTGSGSGTLPGDGTGTGGTGGTGAGGSTGTTEPGTVSSGDPGGTSDPGSEGSAGTGGSGDTTGSGTGTGTNGGSGACHGGTGGGGSSGSNHPSGKDRDNENGGSGSQGKSGSDPDGDENGGSDKPGQGGGASSGDQDGNNGSGNDTDFEDDNRGPDRDGSSTPGSSC